MTTTAPNNSAIDPHARVGPVLSGSAGACHVVPGATIPRRPLTTPASGRQLIGDDSKACWLAGA